MKEGFNFYRSDTDKYNDRRIKRLRREYSCLGVCVYEYLLAEIYRDKGYYISYSEDLIFDIAEYWGASEKDVEDIIHYCIEIGLFDRHIWTTKKILTSLGIQKRYVEMCGTTKRRVCINTGYTLLDVKNEKEENPEETQENSEEIQENSEILEETPQNSEETQENSEFSQQKKESK